jgi:hypothetical protein
VVLILFLPRSHQLVAVAVARQVRLLEKQVAPVVVADMVAVAVPLKQHKVSRVVAVQPHSNMVVAVVAVLLLLVQLVQRQLVVMVGLDVRQALQVHR